MPINKASGAGLGAALERLHDLQQTPAPSASSDSILRSVAANFSRQHSSAPSPTPAPPQREAYSSATRAALISKIDECGAELQTTAGDDIGLERSTKLAACIAECARAVAAMDT